MAHLTLIFMAVIIGFQEPIVTATGSMTIDATGEKVSYRFTEQDTQTIIDVRPYIHSISAPPRYRIGFQTDSGTGIPSGTWVGGSVDYTVDWIPIGTGWQRLTFNASFRPTLTAGTTYHGVIEYVSGTIGANNWAAFAKMTPVGTLYQSQPLKVADPYLNYSDANANTLFRQEIDGFTWSIENAAPVLTFRATDTTQHRLFPYVQPENTTNTGPAERTSEKFKITGGNDIDITRVGARLSRAVFGFTGAQVKYRIQDVDAGEALIEEGDLIAYNSVTATAGGAWYDKDLAATRRLTAGKTYRFTVFIDQLATGRYIIFWGLSGTGAESLNQATWHRTDGVRSRSTDSGSTWTDYAVEDVLFRIEGSVAAPAAVMKDHILTSGVIPFPRA